MNNQRIDIIAPASGSTARETEKAISFAKKWGFTPRISEDIHCDNQYFISNNDECRINDFKKALYADDSEIIWCLRGGYGTARIMSDLIKLEKPKTKKLLIGFSDITNLHILFNQIWNMPSLHAPVLLQLGAKVVDSNSVELLKEVLFCNHKTDYSNLKPINQSAENSKEIEGEIIGGNLSIIQTTIGTNWQLNANRKILFLEDVGVKGYAIDRMLHHLKDAGILNDIKAIIVGDISGEKERNGEIITDEVVMDFFKNHEKPVFKLKGIGHEKTNNPLFMGMNYKISKYNHAYSLITQK